MAIKFVNGDLPVAAAEIECQKIFIVFANLVEYLVDPWHWQESRSARTLLRVLLKLATTYTVLSTASTGVFVAGKKIKL